MTYPKAFCFAGSLIALLLASSEAHAVAIYSAEATSTLTVTGFANASGTPIAKPGDLLVEGGASVFDEFTLEEGDATASAAAVALVTANDPLNLMVGEGLSLDASVVGSATFPPLSTSEAVARTDGLIFLDNLSPTNTYRVDFELAISWSVDASVSGLYETARSEARVLLDTLSAGVLFELLEIADTSTADGPGSDSSIFTASLTLAPGEFDEIAVRTDATGSAVPEPSSAVFVGLGLACLGSRRLLAPR
jgi:hypothetical protein